MPFSRTLIVFLFAAFCCVPAAAPAQEQPGDFVFASVKRDNWSAEARTSLRWPDTGKAIPTVADITCNASGTDFQLQTDRIGRLVRLRFEFGEKRTEDGYPKGGPLLGDHLWLFLDGERVEFANIQDRKPVFSNVRYPAEKSEIILPTWRGHQAFRITATDPWLPLERLYERLIRANRIEWAYKSRDWKQVDASVPENQLPERWRTARFEVNIGGLRDAAAWCASEVQSDAAYTLPDTIYYEDP